MGNSLCHGEGAGLSPGGAREPPRALSRDAVSSDVLYV